MGIQLLSHNQKAYEEVVKILANQNKAAVIHPTGTGKSFIALKWIEENKDKKILYLSPSLPIINQLKRNIVESDLEYGDLNLERITYQKLTNMRTSTLEKLHADMIILDEFHHCGAPEWGKAVEQLLQMNPNAKVLGLSATPMRYFDGELRDMAEELFDGNVASEMTLEEAITNGILNEPDYTTGLYEMEEITKGLEEKIQACEDGEKRSAAEKELETLKTMLEKATSGLPELLEEKMTNKAGKYIVYCRNIQDMENKMEKAQDMFGKVNTEIEIMKVSSKEGDVRKNSTTIRKFEKADDEKLKLLFSVDMLNEGYHLNDLDGIIMMRPTHSPTLYYQQLGRALSVGKNGTPVVIDLVNNIDTIEIIEGFAKSLQTEKTRLTNAKNTHDGKGTRFKISEETRQIQDIVHRIDSLVKREQRLSHQEKLQILKEYRETIGENIKGDTVYKGYPIGNWKSNYRQSHRNGALLIENELLDEFKKERHSYRRI